MTLKFLFAIGFSKYGYPAPGRASAADLLRHARVGQLRRYVF